MYVAMLVRPVHTSSRDRAPGELELRKRGRKHARIEARGTRQLVRAGRPVAQSSQHRLGRGAELDRLTVSAGEPEDIEDV